MKENADITIVIDGGGVSQIVARQPITVRVLDLDNSIVENFPIDTVSPELEEHLGRLEKRIYDQR